MHPHTKKVLIISSICSTLVFSAFVAGTIWVLKHPDKVQSVVNTVVQAATTPEVNSSRAETLELQRIARPRETEKEPPLVKVAKTIGVVSICYILIVLVGMAIGKIGKKRMT